MKKKNIKVDELLQEEFRLVRLVRGGRFLAEAAKTFPVLFSDVKAVTGGCRFAIDDVVEDENDERRLFFSNLMF